MSIEQEIEEDAERGQTETETATRIALSVEQWQPQRSQRFTPHSIPHPDLLPCFNFNLIPFRAARKPEYPNTAYAFRVHA